MSNPLTRLAAGSGGLIPARGGGRPAASKRDVIRDFRLVSAIGLVARRPRRIPAVTPGGQSMAGSLQRFFRLEERSTTVATELRAGLVTFLTMAYILLVNPQILGAAGMPPSDVVFATAVGSAVGTLAMALLTNYPFALAPGMGINAYFAYSVVGGMKVSWQVALTAVFVSGLLFMLLSAGGIRTVLLRAIPQNVKLAIGGGIGLFLALIGFENAGLVQKHPVTMITLGNLHDPRVLLALGGLLLMGVLLALRFRGALLVGIAASTVAAWLLGV